MKDAIKYQSVSTYKNLVCILCCNLLNVGGWVKQTSKTFETF